MKTIEEQMAFYAAYHQDARNKATHFVGVPAIMLSLFIPLAWIRFDAGGVILTAAMLFAAVVLIYYFLLDVPLALAMLVITGILVLLGEKIAALGSVQGWSWFAVLFVGGWILQLVGHVSSFVVVLRGYPPGGFDGASLPAGVRWASPSQGRRARSY